MLDGGDDGEYSGVGIVAISTIVVMQDVDFYGQEPFDRVYTVITWLVKSVAIFNMNCTSI